jgi:hypothetical protein
VVASLRFSIFFFVLDVLKINVRYDCTLIGIYNASHFHDLNVLEQECLVTAFSTCACNNSARPCCCSSAMDTTDGMDETGETGRLDGMDGMDEIGKMDATHRTKQTRWTRVARWAQRI